MDPTFAGSAAHYAPLVEAGTLTAAAAVACATVTGTIYSLRARRRQRRWQTIGASLGLLPPRKRQSRSLTSPSLVAGTYRGRFIEAILLPGSTETVGVTARIANPRHLLDRVSSADSLPRWVSPQSRVTLLALPPKPTWSLEVRGNGLTLSAPCAVLLSGTGEIRPFRELLDLACDLAEGVDGAANPVLLTTTHAVKPLLRRR